MATDVTDNEIFAVNLAALAREIAMDIFPLGRILEIHKLSDDEWQRISTTPKFTQMLAGMIQEWNSASNTKERIKVKAATGLEMHLEDYINDLADVKIPLTQRVEAGKFLAHLGELMGKEIVGSSGGAFQITLNIGATHIEEKLAPTIEGSATRVVDSSTVRGAIPE
jgi:hypothetical protein